MGKILSTPICSRHGTIVLGLAGTSLIAFWAIVVFVLDVDFWRQNHEALILSLGHAINIDHWLVERGIGKGRIHGYMQYHDPGLLYQFLCWILYRLSAAEWGASAQELAHRTLQDPQRFLMAVQTGAMGLVLAGLTLVWHRIRGQGPLVVAAVLGSFFVIKTAWAYSFLLFNTDSFALLMAGLFVLSAERAFSHEPARLGAWAWFGVVAALAYLTKLQYLAWAAAAFVGHLTTLFLGRFQFREYMMTGLSFLGGFAGTLVLGGFLLDGKLKLLQLGRMFAFQFDVLLHDGKYGSGGTNVIDLDRALNTISTRLADANGLYLTAGLIIMGFVWAFITNRRDLPWRTDHGFIGVVIGSAIILGLMAELKHPSEHYLVAVAALLPFATIWLFEVLGHRWVWVALPVVAVFTFLAANETWQAEKKRVVDARRFTDTRESILALPREEGETILWTYWFPGREFLTRFAIQWTSVRDYDFRIGDQIFPFDREYNIWTDKIRIKRVWHSIDELNWRYAVISYKPNILPEAFRGKDLRRTIVGETLVLENRPGP